MGKGRTQGLIKHPSQHPAFCLSHPEQMGCYYSFLCCLAVCLPWYLFDCLFVPRKRTQQFPRWCSSPPSPVVLVKLHFPPSPRCTPGTDAHRCSPVPLAAWTTAHPQPLSLKSGNPTVSDWPSPPQRCTPPPTSDGTILLHLVRTLVTPRNLLIPLLPRVSTLCLISILTPDAVRTF